MNTQTQKTQHESGADLFSRLVSQKMTQSDRNLTQSDTKLTQLENVLMINKSLNIDFKIFPNSINNKEVIDIFGKVGLGKTELIVHLIARCLLPVQWRIDLKKLDESNKLSNLDENIADSIIQIDLSDYSCLDQNQIPKVIFIETESKFNLLRLYSILENRIYLSLDKFCINKNDSLKEELKLKFQSNQFQSLLKKFIRECLKNLTIYRCYNSEQFILALAACELLIQSLISNGTIKSVITPIFIDSINSNFEINDKYNNSIGLGDYDHTEKYTVQLVKKMVDRYNICFIATRSDFRLLSNEYNSYKKWQTCVNKHIELKQEVISKESNNENGEENEENFTELKMKRSFFNLVEFSKIDQSKDINAKVIRDKVVFSIENFGFFVE